MGNVNIKTVNIGDINPLEHITSDLAKARTNYEAILNGLVTWNTTDSQEVTVRLVTDDDPGFVDYTFPSRSMFSKTNSVFGSTAVGNGQFDYDNMLDIASTTTDVNTLRLSVDEGHHHNWTLYQNVVVYDEADDVATRGYIKGSFIRVRSATTPQANGVYVSVQDVNAGDTISSTCRRAITLWKHNEVYLYSQYPGIVAYRVVPTGDGNNSLRGYILRGGSNSEPPGSADSNWDFLAESLNDLPDGATLSKGELYLYYTPQEDPEADPDYTDATMYMYIGDGATKADGKAFTPFDEAGHLDEDNWYGPIMVAPVVDFEKSSVLHHTPTTDIRGYILQSRSPDRGQVSVLANTAIKEGSSEPHQGVGLFNSCNFISWPNNTHTLWQRGTDYSTSGSYTAKMLFHHADDMTKNHNIINYDGPDLDCGLAIYLPAEDVVRGPKGEASLVEARDGAMFEFMFRIWPNTEYNGKETADLIINKSQIYVYSLPRADMMDDGAEIIAKFSMARLTNFYVWAENIAIPNRPVFYKARFIYSKTSKEWRTYDYYQVPDHVFLSPKGFVDPSDREDDGVYGTDRPYTGVQTAGFPLMQDPFGGMDLGAVKLNRIES